MPAAGLMPSVTITTITYRFFADTSGRQGDNFGQRPRGYAGAAGERLLSTGTTAAFGTPVGRPPAAYATLMLEDLAMIRELAPIDISQAPELLRLAEEVERTGRPRRLRRGDIDVAVLVPARACPALADPDDIWAGYDPDAVREALRQSAGALEGVDRDTLLADLYAQREQDSRGRPA